MTKFTPFTAKNHPIPAGLFEDWTEQEKADYANEWAAEFAEEYGWEKCEHNTSRTMADHGNVTLSECDWGCGAILISITGEDGITRTMTADEALDLEKRLAELEAERDTLRAAYEVACEIFRTQAITLPRLRDKWRTAVQQVEGVVE